MNGAGRPLQRLGRCGWGSGRRGGLCVEALWLYFTSWKAKR